MDRLDAAQVERLAGTALNKKAVLKALEELLTFLYPGYYGDCPANAMEDVAFRLEGQIAAALRRCGAETNRAREMTRTFMERLPQIRAVLETDIQAALSGDPAASSRDEVILAYPGLYAVSVYRIAHELLALGVPLIPRIMTEQAHSVTGIDIHPGAQIGESFFMDHGTGIVIGETTVIGSRVKLYQGVTLGCLSTKGAGALRGVKRHPTLEDNVTVYSGATILGGDTVIGAGAVVGSGAFVTKSVARGARVTQTRRGQEPDGTP